MEFEFTAETTRILLFFVASLCLYYFIQRWFRELTIAPGPTGLPLFGYMLFLGKKPHYKLKELSKKYGDIFSLYMGPHLHTFVCDFDAAKEILNHPYTLGRPTEAFEFLVGRGGILGSNGEEWHEQRRFVMSTMRNLGLGKGPWEIMIQEDAAEFVKEIQKSDGKPYDIHDSLQLSQASNNVALLIGRRLDKSLSNPEIQVIQRTSAILLKYFTAVNVLTVVPWLGKVLAGLRIGGYHTFYAQLKEFEDLFRKEVLKRLQKKDVPYEDDFIGLYLKEWEQRKNDAKSHYFSVDRLIGNMVILFIAGNDSTLSSVSWLLLLTAAYPDVQRKIHEEIEEVFGTDGQIHYDDRKKLPYTMATVMEMERFISLSPIFPPRIAEETFKFRGHTIPKGSNIVVSGWAIMHDERYMKDPFDFQPERFLHEEGQKVSKQQGYAPFSFGKRNCPGENVALMTIFLYFVSILQKFRVEMPHGIKPDFDCDFGSVLHCRRQKLCFIER